MKPITKQPRKARPSSTRLGFLAAASGFALVSAISGLSAQSTAETSNSGGYTTAGIPVGDDVFGLQPVAVGPAAQPSGLSPVATPGAVEVNAPVRRGRWVTSVTPYAHATVTFSDNINLAVDGEEEDELVGTVGVGAVFAARNQRFAGQLAAEVNYDTFLNGTNDDGIRASLSTNWSAAVVPNLFYVDVAGGVSESFVTGDRFSGNQVANADDRARSFYGLISPSIRKNIGGWANTEVRYTARGEYTDDDDLDGGISHTLSAGITSDPRKFRRFGWQAATEYEIYDPQEDNGGEDLERWTSYASVDVPVSRTLAVTGTVGYDHFTDDVADSDVSGVFGNAGLRWQPNTRFAARAFAGYRYDGFDYGVEANYALRQNVVAGIEARRAVQFTDFTLGDTATPIPSEFGADGRVISYESATGTGTTTNINDALAFNSTDPNTLARFGDINSSGDDNDAIVDTVRAYVSGTTGRTSWNANVQAAQYDYGSGFEADETILSANVDVSRALTSRLGASAGIGFAAVSYDETPGTTLTNSDYETLSLGLGLDYQLTEIVNVFGRYTYTERFADQPGDEYSENAVVIGVNASF